MCFLFLILRGFGHSVSLLRTRGESRERTLVQGGLRFLRFSGDADLSNREIGYSRARKLSSLRWRGEAGLFQGGGREEMREREVDGLG